jgi:hypothetical protein
VYWLTEFKDVYIEGNDKISHHYVLIPGVPGLGNGLLFVDTWAGRIAPLDTDINIKYSRSAQITRGKGLSKRDKWMKWIRTYGKEALNPAILDIESPLWSDASHHSRKRS